MNQEMISWTENALEDNIPTRITYADYLTICNDKGEINQSKCVLPK